MNNLHHRANSLRKRQPFNMLAALLALVLPGLVLAEGAVRVLTCKTVQVCDGAARCAPANGDTTYRMAPLAQQGDGSGSFTLSYAGSEVPMQALSEAGPFVWQAGETRYTLLANSNTEFVLHALTLAPVPMATLQFMQCTFRQ